MLIALKTALHHLLLPPAGLLLLAAAGAWLIGRRAGSVRLRRTGWVLIEIGLALVQGAVTPDTPPHESG